MFPLILSLASLNAWKYAGFLAQPSKPTPPPAATPALEPTIGPPIAPAPTSVEAPPANDISQLDARPQTKPAAANVAEGPATKPVRYQIADSTGQIWEHTDPDFLQEFVRDRNRQFVAQPR